MSVALQRIFMRFTPHKKSGSLPVVLLFSVPLWFRLIQQISTLNVITFDTDIYGPQRMNPLWFLHLYLVPQAGVGKELRHEWDCMELVSRAAAPLSWKELLEVAVASTSRTCESLPAKVFPGMFNWAESWKRTCWSDYRTYLGWDCRGIPREELEDMARGKDVLANVPNLLPPRPEHHLSIT